jgi:hypothetical protein
LHLYKSESMEDFSMIWPISELWINKHICGFWSNLKIKIMQRQNIDVNALEMFKVLFECLFFFFNLLAEIIQLTNGCY